MVQLENHQKEVLFQGKHATTGSGRRAPDSAKGTKVRHKISFFSHLAKWRLPEHDGYYAESNIIA